MHFFFSLYWQRDKIVEGMIAIPIKDLSIEDSRRYLLQSRYNDIHEQTARSRHRNLDLIRSKLRVLCYRSVRSFLLAVPCYYHVGFLTVTSGLSSREKAAPAHPMPPSHRLDILYTMIRKFKCLQYLLLK